MKLSENEVDILGTLWNAGRALSRTEIINFSLNKNWKASSIHILLNSLLNKGAIREAGFIRSGKSFARTFEPTTEAEDYFAEQISSAAKKTSPIKIMSYLVSGDIDDSVLDELEKIIQEKRKYQIL